MADYTKTTWQTGDIIDATKINNLETQYDTAKAAQRAGEWTMQADLDVNTHGINGVTDINDGAVSLTDGNIEIADNKVYKIGGLTVLSDPVSPTGKYAKDDGTWATPTATAAKLGGFDYFIYKDGSVYYAKNMSTGDTDYSNTNLATVISNILGVVTDAAIEFAANTVFTVPTGGIPIYDCNGVRFCGENEYTTIFQASDSCTTGVIDVRSMNVIIENLTIDGNNKASTVGLCVGSQGNEARYAYHFSARNLIINNCATAGIQIWDDVNYTNFDSILCATGHGGYGLEFRGDAYSDYNSGQVNFYNCIISGPSGAVRRYWTAGGTMKGVAFFGCDFQDGHSGTYQVDCKGIYNVLFDRCIFETSTNGYASTAQIHLDSYGVVFNECSFAHRSSLGGGHTFIDNSHSYSTAGHGGYVFISPKVYNSNATDTTFGIDEGVIICPSRESISGALYSTATKTGCTIIDPHNDEGAALMSSGTIAIANHTAITDPGATTSNRLLKDDGTWCMGVLDEFKYILFKSGSTYYAYDTVNQSVTSNATFATLVNGLITTTGLTFKLLPGTYSVGATIAALGTGYAGGRIVGASEASTILQASTGLTDGIIRIGGDNWEISNLTFDGNNQSGCVGLRMGDKPGEGLYTALRCSVKDSTFKNFSAGTFPTCLKLDGNTYYENFENLRMMDNNLYGIHFNDDTGGLGDNGQTLFSNCEIAANYYCVWRTAAAATRHRIEFDRCGFYCGSASATYAVDFAGINNLHVNQCDFEATNTPLTAFVGVGGQNQVFTACSVYANGIPLFKSHWGGTNSGLVFTGLQCGGNSSTTIFDIDYAFTVIEPNVSTTEPAKWFANITTKRRCTMVGGQTQRLPFNNAWAQLKDDFQGASLNGDIWVTTDSGAGASVAMVSDATGGVVRIATGATINTTGVLNNGTMDNISFANYPAMEAVVKLDATPANVVHFIGLYTDSTHYLGFRIDTAVSTNWYAVCCNGGSETATSLGVAGDTTLRYLKFYMEPSTDTAFFFIDDQYKTTLVATNMPVTGACSVRASCKCLTAADKHLDIDLIDVRYRRQT